MVVPAPALPSWPPPTNPTAPGGYRATTTPGYSLPPAGPGPNVPPVGPGVQVPPADSDLNGAPADAGAGPNIQAGPPYVGSSARLAAGPPDGRVSPAQATTSAPPAQYGDGARGQQPGGTVYGGAAGTSTSAMRDQVENSGSLTGHILAQGWADTPTQQSNNNKKVVLVLLVGLAFLVAVGLLVVLLVGDSFNSLFGGLLGG
ncbi:hypothetical protein [Plantactinospora sp. B5E13]|uniref:hypothetical protein n=1 Tax=Plantactinospora sp. B5E13 TaxID=3153758 RepID=UPI00325C595D